MNDSQKLIVIRKIINKAGQSDNVGAYQRML